MIHSTGILLLSTVIDFYFRVRFNPVEKDLLCATVSDRSIGKSLEILFFFDFGSKGGVSQYFL